MPTNRTIALAAVVVSGAVGTLAPIVTWQAAMEGQRAASDDDRRRSDLVELRRTLDESIKVFHRLRVAQRLELVAWQNRKPRREYLARHLASARAMAAAESMGDRLAARLGRDEEAYRLYTSAAGATFGATLHMYNHPYRRSSLAGFSTLANEGVEFWERFQNRTFELIGVQTD